MRNITLTAALVVLTGCSSTGGFMGMGGSGGGDTRAAEAGTYERAPVTTAQPRTTPRAEGEVIAGQQYDGGTAGTTQWRTYAGGPYSESEIRARYRYLPRDERQWPPVYEGQAFPQQDMWSD